MQGKAFAAAAVIVSLCVLGMAGCDGSNANAETSPARSAPKQSESAAGAAASPQSERAEAQPGVSKDSEAPVAKVSVVERRGDSGFAQVQLAPIAQPDSARHVLVLQPMDRHLIAKREADVAAAAEAASAAEAKANARAAKKAERAEKAAEKAAAKASGAAP